MLRHLLLAICALLLSAIATASSYEAKLPEQLASDPDMCRYLDCKAVLPQAASFSPRQGKPPYVIGRDANGRTAGYVYLSTDVADIPAYSGKPVVTLVGMDARGKIVGVRILKHSEPILLLGIPEQKLTDYVNQYLGHMAGTRFELGKSDDKAVALDAISGATVTLIAENQLLTRTSQAIARQVGLIKQQARAQTKFADDGKMRDWAALQADGAVQPLRVEHADVGLPDTGKPYLDLHFGYLNHPQVGRSVLGEAGWRELMARLKPGEHVIFAINDGAASFKGSGFVRGGIYDRVQLRQGDEVYTFRDSDYLNLYAMQAAGAPRYHESAIFIVRDATFSAAYPFHFVFLANRQEQESSQKTFVNFASEYWLPGAYLQGGRPADGRELPAWQKTWQARLPEVITFGAFLLFTLLFYAQRERLARASSRRDKRHIDWPRYVLWGASVAVVGFAGMAQPSVTQLLTLLHALLDGWRWELFLSDPLIFLFWIFIAVSLLLWGRGVFCGWLCPFGSLSEGLYRVAGKLGFKRWQRQLPQRWHDRLKWLKYGVLAVLVAASLHSMVLAEQLAEVEPFKTTFLVGIWQRSWPYGLFVAALLALSLFTERPYCKYLCPLGAGLAIPSWLRVFSLKRKHDCGPCQACTVQCGAQAIAKDGRIDPAECLHCLDCLVYYYDDHACPPLAKERKRRAKAGEALTPIGRDGYYIPIREVK